jgi:predicted RNase H-like nuclease (RuvC/YqgF family)
MLAMLTRRMSVVRTLLLWALSGAGWVAQGADFDRARDLVARVQDDLQRAADFTRTNEKERDRYQNVQHHLSEFDRELRRDHFDKGKLDDAIDNLKDLVKNNTLESHDRDALASDLSDLRTLRDIR